MVKVGQSDTYVVRNDRKYYDNDKKPDWNAVLNKAICGYDRKEVVPYAPCGATKPDGTPDKTCTETNYYKGNQLLASVYDVKSKDSNHMSIKTEEADYHDWDRDGQIDCRDIDKVYNRNEIKLTILRQYSNNRPIIDGILITKIITENPQITMQDIQDFNDKLSNYSFPARNLFDIKF